MKNTKLINLLKSVTMFALALVAINCFLSTVVKAQRPDVLWMRSGSISSIVSSDYSPDGQMIATIERDIPVVKIWRVSDGMLIRSLKIPGLWSQGGAINGTKVKYLSDGQSIFVKCYENNLYSVKLVRISDGAVITTFGSEVSLSTFGMMPDGTLAIGAGTSNNTQNSVKFFDFSSGALQSARTITSITYVNSTGATVVWGPVSGISAFSANGRIGGGDAYIIDMSGRLIGYFNGGTSGSTVRSINDSGDLTGINNNIYRVSQLCYPNRPGVCATPLISSQSYHSAFSPDGQTIATTNGAGNALNLYRSNFTLITSLPVNNSPFEQPIFSPDSQNILFDSYFDNTTQFNAIKILNASDGILVRRLESHYSSVENVLFSPDGLTALSLSVGFPESTLTNNYEAIIRVWNPADGTLISSIPTGVARSGSTTNNHLALSPDGKFVFVRPDGAIGIKIFRISDGTLINTINTGNSSYGFVLSPNGQFVAYVSSSITLIRVSDGATIWSRPSSSLSLAFTPDGLGLFNGNSLLNSSNGNLIRNFTLSASLNLYSISTSSDGQSVAFTGSGPTGNDGITEIRRISDASLIRTFTRTGGGRNYVAKFSPNNQQIAIAGFESAIRFYNLTDGTLARFYDEEVTGYSSSNANVQSLEFSPDGSRFAYGRYDATMVVAANPCLYSLSQPSIITGADGGNISFNITTAPGCAWQAVSNSTWLTGSNSGNGNGTINFTFAANTGTPRTGQISVGGETFTINQSASQSYEADVFNRPNGDGFVDSDDIQEIRRFALGLDTAGLGGEYQRADCSFRNTLGDGYIDSDDVVQARRYALGLDTLQLAGGPSAPPPIAPPASDEKTGAEPNGTLTQATDKQSLRTFGKPLAAPAAFRVDNQNTSAGATLVVPIRVDTVGNEAGYTFSIAFDSTKLTNPTVAIGSGGGDVIFNANNPGQIGFSVTSFMGGTIAAANNIALVNVTFTVAAGAPAGTTPITFTDTPARRKASGVDPNTPITQPSFTGGTITISGATAAGGSIGGRVTTQFGRGITNVTVTLTDSQGNSRTAKTTSFGFYRFDDVPNGQNYILQAQAKRYQFTNPTQVLPVNGELTEVNFTASP